MGGYWGIGSGYEAAGVSGQGGFRGNLVLNRLPDRAVLMQRLAQPTTAIQIADHVFSQHLHRLGVRCPLQLLAAGRQMFQDVLQPQKVCFASAHRPPPFCRSSFAGTIAYQCNARANGCGGRPCQSSSRFPGSVCERRSVAGGKRVGRRGCSFYQVGPLGTCNSGQKLRIRGEGHVAAGSRLARRKSGPLFPSVQGKSGPLFLRGGHS